jgi:hypothetical protein
VDHHQSGTKIPGFILDYSQMNRTYQAYQIVNNTMDEKVTQTIEHNRCVNRILDVTKHVRAHILPLIFRFGWEFLPYRRTMCRMPDCGRPLRA